MFEVLSYARHSLIIYIICYLSVGKANRNYRRNVIEVFSQMVRVGVVDLLCQGDNTPSAVL